MIISELFEAPQRCPECGGISFSNLILAEKKDACYHKVKASAKVWPSAYASGRLVQCRKKGAANYGNKNESVAEGGNVFMANIQNTPEYRAGFATGKLPVPHPEGTQEYANYYKGVIDKASPTLSKVGEDTLDEKSVSQAQFRTMAGAAHNPEFARKVGISQDVAQEFNQADKKSNYKKLPTRANEGGAGSGRPDPTSWDTSPGKVGRVEKTATGLRHHADASRYGGTIPEPEHDKLLTPQERWRMDKITQPVDDMDEGEQQKGADYRDPKEVDYDDEYDAMMSRVKRLAGLGPMKTVYDPNKRQYRNMPTAVQPKK